LILLITVNRNGPFNSYPATSTSIPGNEPRSIFPAKSQKSLQSSVQFYNEKFCRAKRHPEAAKEAEIETEIEAAKSRERGARITDAATRGEERGGVAKNSRAKSS
jgi:hypothetical protein